MDVVKKLVSANTMEAVEKATTEVYKTKFPNLIVKMEQNQATVLKLKVASIDSPQKWKYC